MRIAFFADNFYPELSGISDSIIITGSELRRRGHEVIYIAPHYSTSAYSLAHRQFSEENGHETVEGMRVVRLPSLPLPFSPTGQSHVAFPSGKALGVLRQWKPDILHTNSPYGCGLEALRAHTALKVPLVGTNHTPIEEFYPLAPMLMRRFDAWYYNHCSFVSAPFRALIENMRDAGFTSDGRAIANPLVPTIFNHPDAAERARTKETLGLKDSVILYAGRVAPEKHLDVVIRAIAKLLAKYPNIKFVITGHGAAVGSLQALVQELKLSEHVLFTGFLPTETLSLYYKAADVFTIMSTADSQSIALMQAFATGMPAVGARSRGLVDYIPERAGFLVEPGDVSTLAEKLDVLLSDADLRERMGAAGREFVETLTPGRIADEWESVYRAATGTKH